MPESVVTNSVVSFLKNVPPFQFLSAVELSRLAAHMTLEFFPKDTVILHAGHPASESLYVVHKGGVKLALRSQVGKQLVLDMRSEGEIFGLLSLMSKDLARLDVTAIEDTLGEQFYRVVNPQVSIPAETVLIHKLRAEDIREGEALEPVLSDFSQFVADAVLVGHFLDIDLKILGIEMLNHGHKLDNPVIDIAKVHRWLLKRGLPTEDLLVQLGKNDLASVASIYRVNLEDTHHALADAFVTARIWQKMLYSLQKQGVDSRRKLLRIGVP